MLYKQKKRNKMNFEALTSFYTPLKKRAVFWHMNDMKKSDGSKSHHNDTSYCYKIWHVL